MRTTISKSTAVRAVIIAFALIGILTIWPFRLFTAVTQTSGGGTIVSESDYINFERGKIMQEFVAQYNRLSSVDVYVTEVEKGRYIGAILYDENGAMMLKVFRDTNECVVPGYVNIPMDINLEVGKKYAVKMVDCRSKYKVAFETVSDQPAYVGNLTCDYNPIEGLHMAAFYNYRLPLSKGRSLGIIGIIAAVAFVMCLLTRVYFRKNAEKDGIVTVWQTVRCVANPVAVLFFGALMIMVFPLKVFDSRATDIIFYEIGLLVAAVIVLYAINHKPIRHEVGISFWQSLRNEDRAQYLAIMFSMAMAIWYGSQYMNDLFDIYHSISERQLTVWLLVMLLFTFSLKEFFNIYNLVWVIGAGLYGYRYFDYHRKYFGEFEYDLHNKVLMLTVIIGILAGLVALNLVRLAVIAIRDRNEAPAHREKIHLVRPTLFGILLIALFVAMIVFRNTRVWGIYLALVYTAFYIRIGSWNKKKDFYKILSGGLMMNFAISLMFSWLHRYFTGYVSGRFGFIFHTVTVTAEYLTFMGAAALVMLIVKVVALPKGTNLRGVIVSAWKEMTLFGFIMSYAIFTVSRTAYAAIAGTALLVLVVVVACHRRQLGRILAVLVLSVLLCFPAAFTLQRILPTMAADPVYYAIDDADEFVRGGADWDNTNFMCVERFANLFMSKILGAEVGVYQYPIDIYNYDGPSGAPLYDDYGRPYDESPDNPANQGTGAIDLPGDAVLPGDGLLAAVSKTNAEAEILSQVASVVHDELEDYVDTSNPLDVISNGRITIFKSYLKQLNMTGHDEMGVPLPNGEIAIHAHNTYIQVAHDHGIPTGILFAITLVVALVSGIRYYLRKREEEPLSLVTCAIIIGFAVAGISEWVFQYSNPMTIALMLSLAPLTYRIKEK
ncbi:O-antigen ligase family protein [Butyrivibrio sp. FCS014]|uniref:O-antigen ligase family protein n=1 Tax=Butyrivibrio sp. FCS014 TaxID=1408304 RepID=UPI000465D882|nr:hypothetical protein [Butyrivibrio sp. FCS014]